jgi:hypothetical protein
VSVKVLKVETRTLPFLNRDPPSEQQVQGTRPSCCERRAAVWSGVFEPTIRVWRSGTTRKQPVNLAVEGAEESLSIISDYTPTVRPPPKRC